VVVIIINIDIVINFIVTTIRFKLHRVADTHYYKEQRAFMTTN